MNQQMPLDAMIASWMAGEAAVAPEGLLEGILETTRQSAPRPRWWALLRESPLAGRTSRAAVGLPNRGLVLAAIVALLLLALAAVVVGTSLLLKPPPPAGVSGDWPGFRGDADHGGVGLVGPVGNPVLDWRIRATGSVLEVALVGDRAFFASGDGRLLAVSRDAGIERWSVPVGAAPLVGPYAADGRLYVFDAGGLLRAYAQVDGAPLWTSPATYAGPSRLISVDGTLYLGTSDGFIVAIDGASGAERWRLQPPGARQVDAPAFGSGLLFAGTDGAGFVAIDPATHAVVWRGDTNDEDTGTASVADGIAYIGAAPDAFDGRLRAFDATTGRLLWTGEDDLLEIPTVADGVAFSGTSDGLLAAIDTASGRTLWRIHVPSEVRPPVVVGDVVYFAAGLEHRVYAVDAATGAALWQFDLDANANCCVAVAKGTVYVATEAGSVFAIGGDGAPIAGSPPATAEPSAGGATATAAGTPHPTPVALAVTWSTDLRGMGFAPICQIAVDPQGRIWAPEADTGRIAIFAPDGSFIEEWDGPDAGSDLGPFDFTRSNGDGYGTLDFEDDGSFFVLDVGHWRVVAFDANRNVITSWGAFGNLPREYDDAIAIDVAIDGTVWVLDDVRGVAEHYDRSGKVLGWFDAFSNVATTKGANSMAIGPNGHVYISQVSPNQVVEFDTDGTVVRAFGSNAFPTDQPSMVAVDPDGRVFVTQGPNRGDLPGVTVFAADGTDLGGFAPIGTGDGQLRFAGGIALDGEGSVYVMDSDPDSARLVKFELAPPFAS